MQKWMKNICQSDMIFCTTIFVSDFMIKFRFYFDWVFFIWDSVSVTFHILPSLSCSRSDAAFVSFWCRSIFLEAQKMYWLEDQSPCQQQKPSQFPTKPIAWKDTTKLCLESQRPTNALCKCQDQAAYKPSQSSLAVRIIIGTEGGLEEPNKMERRTNFLVNHNESEKCNMNN